MYSQWNTLIVVEPIWPMLQNISNTLMYIHPFLHLQAFGAFGLCQVHAFVDYLRSKLTDKQFQLLFKSLAITVGVVTVVVGGALTAMDSIHTLSV